MSIINVINGNGIEIRVDADTMELEEGSLFLANIEDGNDVYCAVFAPGQWRYAIADVSKDNGECGCAPRSANGPLLRAQDSRTNPLTLQD